MECLGGRLTHVQLSQGPDEFRWNLQTNGLFPVDSMYRALVHSDIPVDDNKKIWKMKIPLKSIFFAWYLRKGFILIKDNLVKRNWQGSTNYIFYLQEESIKHLFFQCRVARSIWSAIQIASNLYPPRSVANVFGN